MGNSSVSSFWCEDIVSCLIVFLELEDLHRLRILNRDFQNSVDTRRPPFAISIGNATLLVQALISRDKKAEMIEPIKNNVSGKFKLSIDELMKVTFDRFPGSTEILMPLLTFSKRTRKILSKADLYIDSYTKGIPTEESLPYFHSIVWVLDGVKIPREFFDAFLDEKYAARFSREPDPYSSPWTENVGFKQFVDVFDHAQSIQGIYVKTRKELEHYAPFFNKCQWVKILHIGPLSQEDCLIIARTKKVAREPVKWILSCASDLSKDCDLKLFDEIELFRHYSRIDVSRLRNVKSVKVDIDVVAGRDEFISLRRAHQSWNVTVESLEVKIMSPNSWNSFLTNIDILDNLSNCRELFIVTSRIESIDLKPVFQQMGERINYLRLGSMPGSTGRKKITVDFPQQVSLNRLSLSDQYDFKCQVIFTSESLEIDLRKQFRFPHCKHLRVIGYRESGLNALLDNWPSGLKLLIIVSNEHHGLKDLIASAIHEGRFPSGCKIGFQDHFSNPKYYIIYEEGKIDLLHQMESDQDIEDLSDHYSSDLSS